MNYIIKFSRTSIDIFKPYLLTFTNRFISGIAFGFGMGIAWRFQPRIEESKIEK